MRRRVVVTGGAKGIGLATALRFQALGDEVTVLGRDGAALRAAAERHGLNAVACDVTDERQVTETLAAGPAVDVLVNNAGMAESAPLHRTTLEQWNRHLEVNATAAFLCLTAVLPAMRARRRGVIVNVASTAGRIGTPYTAAYTASKHALVGLTRAAAAELAGTGIRVNAVCPTFVRTELTERSIATIVQRTGRTAAQAERALAEQSPLGRLLEPDEVAAAIVHLASEEARSMSGQAIVLDGGAVQA